MSQSFEKPISVVVPAGTTRTISFAQEFFRDVSSIIITNLDSANNATYQINGTSSPLLTLQAGDFRTINLSKIELITITAGAVAAVQVEAIGKPKTVEAKFREAA